MKRCPECRRDYIDNTLLYCLDDGSALLEGPASGDTPTAFLVPNEAIRTLTAEMNTELFTADPPATLPLTPSIAVLPFVHLTSDPEDQYFCDGLAEEILNALSRLDQLRVAARTSSFSFKDKNVEVGEVGRILRVANVLSGSFRKIGTRLRISVQLVSTHDGYQLWSERYDREMRDIFDVQDEITLAVVEALKLKLLPTQSAVFLKRGTEDTEAYQYYLKGRFLWNRRDAEDLEKALEQFHLSVSKDPNYALAYVGLADTYVVMQEYTGIRPSESLPKAREFAQRALAIDGTLGEAHSTLGAVHAVSWEWEEAEKEFARAIALSPNYPTAYQWFGNVLRDRGRLDEAAVQTLRAQELDPLSAIIDINVGIILMLKGDVDSALAHFRKTTDLHTNWWGGHFHLGMGFIKKGLFADAIVELEKSVQMSGRTKRAVGLLGCAYGLAGERSAAEPILQELKDRLAKQESTSLNIAEVYLGMGDRDQMFYWLQNDAIQRGGDVARITWYPHFESVRDDPRFADLVRSMGLSDPR
jgi:TolB-like protein/Flp pilus assembly protein TadD